MHNLKNPILRNALVLSGLAVSALGAGGTSAGEVAIHGLLDMGLNYSVTDVAGESTSTLQLASGQNGMSRWSLSGAETLSPSLKAGFVLESGVALDSGELMKNLHGALFGREAQVYLEGRFGTIKLGRLASFVSGFNQTGLFGPKVSPFSAGWLNVPGHKSVMTGEFAPYDNMVVYSTPKFGAWQAHLQYSFGPEQEKITDAGLEEGTEEVDRAAAAAVTFTTGNAHAVVIVDTLAYGNLQNADARLRDARRVSLGGHYDFGPVKVFAAGQWFEGVQKLAMGELDTGANLLNKVAGRSDLSRDGIDGLGLNVGVTIPVNGFLVKLSTGYMKAENAADSSIDIDRATVSAGFEYTLSKKTFLYAAAGWQHDAYGRDDIQDADRIGVAAGLVTRF